MTLTVYDRELIARLERESRTVFPERMRDGHSYHATAHALDLAADRLQSLLSDRDKLREALVSSRAGWENVRDALNSTARDSEIATTYIEDIDAALRSTDNG
jgi:hypothetical protein